MGIKDACESMGQISSSVGTSVPHCCWRSLLINRLQLLQTVSTKCFEFRGQLIETEANLQGMSIGLSFKMVE